MPSGDQSCGRPRAVDLGEPPLRLRIGRLDDVEVAILAVALGGVVGQPLALPRPDGRDSGSSTSVTSDGLAGRHVVAIERAQPRRRPGRTGRRTCSASAGSKDGARPVRDAAVAIPRQLPAVAAGTVDEVELRRRCRTRCVIRICRFAGCHAMHLRLPELGVTREAVGDRLRDRRHPFDLDVGGGVGTVFSCATARRRQEQKERGTGEMSHVSTFKSVLQGRSEMTL